MYNDKLTQSIAEAAKKCMDEELKGNQHKIDANKNGKIDADDFKKLRKEETVEEAMQKSDVPAYLRKQKGEKPLSVADVKGPRPDSISSKEGLAKLRNEETEELQEADIEKTSTGMRVYGSSYGNSVRARREQVKKSVDAAKGPKMKDLEAIEGEKKKKKFSEMVETYVQSGIQGLFEGWKKVKEEATNDEFKSELEKQKAKAEGKAPQADVAKAAVQAVQSEATHTQIQVVDMTDPNNIQKETIDLEERSLSEPEMKKREEVVKSMKKGIQGFKDRYGDRAKEVMYATATKIAKKD